MSVFQDYSRYYNLLYKDKNYTEEAAFVLDILENNGCKPNTLLDLGCGTGRHALEMAKQGICVTGVDSSDSMLKLGNASLGSHPGVSDVHLPKLLQGDARTVRLGKKFDAVVSLFHVMSYQNSEEDAVAEFMTAREHLEQEGMFFFDFWHGPGVLRDLPEKRERVLDDETTRVRRLAVPELRVNDNIVVVNYDVHIANLENGQTSELREAHSMRYWFLPELRHLAGQAGLRVVDAGGWLKNQPPCLADWTAWMLVSL